MKVLSNVVDSGGFNEGGARLCVELKRVLSSSLGQDEEVEGLLSRLSSLLGSFST